MNIDLLSRMVKDLILDSNEVPLPGIGAFVAELMPSTFSDKGYTINPPYRRLYFRQRSTGAGDDALARYYAEGNGISLGDARRILGDFLVELKEVLEQKKVVVFPGLGRLRATKENNFFFIADEDLDIYPEGIGLEPISLKTHVETEEEVAGALDGFKAIMEDIPQAPVAEEVAVEPMTMEDAAPVIEEAPVEEVAPASVEEAPALEETVEIIEVPEEPIVEVVPEPVATEETEPIAEEEPVHTKNTGKLILLVCLCIVLVCLLLVAGFLVAVHVAPDWVDTLLYSPEELDLIHSSGL